MEGVGSCLKNQGGLVLLLSLKGWGRSQPASQPVSHPATSHWRCQSSSAMTKSTRKPSKRYTKETRKPHYYSYTDEAGQQHSCTRRSPHTLRQKQYIYIETAGIYHVLCKQATTKLMLIVHLSGQASKQTQPGHSLTNTLSKLLLLLGYAHFENLPQKQRHRTKTHNFQVKDKVVYFVLKQLY